VSTTDVIIIGAGPYGMSAAAHLRTIDGLEVREFGEPMSFWDRNMPIGMLLRSNWTATQIASPKNRLTIEAYMAETSDRLAQPVTLDGFVRYGQWYQQKAVSDLDHRNIMLVESDSKGFKTTLADGETIFSRRVVVAAGIGSFARRPREFDCLPASLASHTSVHRDLKEFAGKKVLVVGGGQSALESAALLHESGAEAEVVSRSTHINWLSGWASTTLHKRLGKFTRQFLYAPTDVGPAGISQLVARPALLQALPRSVQDKLRKRAVRPAGARWLVERLRDVPISLGRSVTSVGTVSDQASIQLDDGTSRKVDHVLLGTGYQVDVSKYEFLSPELIRSIKCFNGFPCLKAGLETSVPGLHMLGAPAAWSFGPLMQFVSGTTYASRSLTHHIAKNRRLY
jgi:FAD-dependent urate hydroxylase